MLFFFGSYKLTHLKRRQGTPGDMALWNRPCLGPLVPQEGFGFKPHWCAGESLAGPLLVSLAWVPTSCQFGLACYASQNNNNNNDNARKPRPMGGLS